MARVTLEHVTKKYGRKTALEAISLTCEQGEFLTIIGPTGAGKTTILKIIAGIEPITSGRLYFNSRLMNDVPPQERNVSMAFETYNLYPHLTVYENVAFPLRAPRWGYRLSPGDEQKAVLEITRFLGIDDLLERLPQHLSGGQKQRVSLARALVRKPEVYLLDEPIAHLDARLKFSTQTLLKRFANEYRTTILYVTHDYREALGLSDRVVVLNRGRIEQNGTPREVYDTPASPFVGTIVGEPPMNFIDGEIVREGRSVIFRSNGLLSMRLQGELATRAAVLAGDDGGVKPVRLGVRSEFLTLTEAKSGPDSFALPIFAVTSEARELIVTLQMHGGGLLYVRVRGDTDAYELGGTVWIELDQTHALLYPPPVARGAKESART